MAITKSCDVYHVAPWPIGMIATEIEKERSVIATERANQTADDVLSTDTLIRMLG